MVAPAMGVIVCIFVLLSVREISQTTILSCMEAGLIGEVHRDVWADYSAQ